MSSRFYSVHDVVRFRIVDRSPFPRSLFDKTEIQFRNFRSSRNTEVDFTVEIGAFNRQERDCCILDDKYFVADGYLYCSDRRKYARWELEVSDIEDKPKIRIHTNLAGYYTVPLNVVEFFIHYMLLRKGKALVHASGIVKEDACCLFSARGGGGKTTIALSLIDEGFGYLGDNFVFLDREMARSFVSPLNIFFYNRLEVVDRNLSRQQRCSMLLKKLLYHLTGGYIKVFEKIDPSDLFGDRIVTESIVYRVYILEPSSADYLDHLAVRPIGTDLLIEKLRYNMELDLQLFDKYMCSYGYINTSSLWAEFWLHYEKCLRENLPENLSAYLVQVPIQYNRETLGRIRREMSSL